MTEAEWLACADPARMLPLLVQRHKVGARRFRLFAVECVRRVWPLLKFEASRRAVDVAEQFAYGSASESELTAARQAADILSTSGLGGTKTYPASRAAHACTDRSPSTAARQASRCATKAGNLKRERAGQVRLLRCLFGNPFRSVVVDPRWLTPTVTALAAAVYAGRAFDRLPILADAMEEIGCDNPDVLAHCRGNGPHVRGSWAVDLILGKN